MTFGIGKQMAAIAIAAAVAATMWTALAKAESVGGFAMRVSRKSVEQSAYSINENDLARIGISLPDGKFEAGYRGEKGEGIFARYSCGLEAEDALKAAVQAMIRGGWKTIFVNSTMAMMENDSGKCAAIGAFPVVNGATTVALAIFP